MTLTAVSLFAGVGGFDLALERNGVNVVAAVEIDNNARGVLKHRFPNTTLFNDVCEVDGGQLIAAGFVPERGIITGGFPCQDLSVAGKRAGLDGARSGLFWEICRLLDETKARYFILENVPGLLSSNNGRDMGAVVGALVERGYGIAYRVLDAQFFGVPQRRRRVVIVGSLGDNGDASSEVLALSESVRGHLEARTPQRKEAARTAADSVGSGSEPVAAFGQTGYAAYKEDAVNTLGATDYKRPEMNVVVKLEFPEKTTGTLTTSFSPKNYDGYQQVSQGSVVAFSHTQGLDAQPSEEATPTLRANGGGQAVAYDEYNDAISDKHHTLRAGTKQSTGVIIPIQDGREIEKKQNGLGVGGEGDPSYTLDQTGGQAVSIVAPTLSATNNPSRSPQSSEVTAQVEAMVNATSTVRRLTPVECERLQGFPDNWTAERYDYKKETVVPQADSARYKQMGNAVAVPVFEWVISRLVAVDAALTQLEEQGGAA